MIVHVCSLWSHGLQLSSLLCPWNCPGMNTGMGCHCLLQGIFLTQGLSPPLQHRQMNSSPPNYLGRPEKGLLLLFVKSLSWVQLFVTPWTAACQDTLSITSHSLLKFMSIESMVLTHLIPCHPLLLLPSIFPSIRVFSKEPALCIRWPKYWSLSFSFIGLSNEYSGLISFWPGVGSSSSVISFHTVHGILTAQILERFAILSPKKTVVLLPAKSLQLCLTLYDMMDCSLPGSSFRQEYWNGLPCPYLGDLPDPGIEPWSPALLVNSLLPEPLEKPIVFLK